MRPSTLLLAATATLGSLLPADAFVVRPSPGGLASTASPPRPSRRGEDHNDPAVPLPGGRRAPRSASSRLAMSSPPDADKSQVRDISETTDDVLEQFGVDFTAKAAEGKLDPGEFGGTETQETRH